MGALFGLVAYIIGLFGTIILVPGIPFCLLCGVLQRQRTYFFIASAMLFGYLGGATLVWKLVPSNWTLPLSTTLAAAGNAAKYGHPTEHYAESILVAMAFAAVVGAIASGGVAALLLTHKHVKARASA